MSMSLVNKLYYFLLSHDNSSTTHIYPLSLHDALPIFHEHDPLARGDLVIHVVVREVRGQGDVEPAAGAVGDHRGEAVSQLPVELCGRALLALAGGGATRHGAADAGAQGTSG